MAAGVAVDTQAIRSKFAHSRGAHKNIGIPIDNNDRKPDNLLEQFLTAL
jgi:hypothetical protein